MAGHSGGLDQLIKLAMFDSATTEGAEIERRREKTKALRHRVDQFKKQLLGQKSEKRVVENRHQPGLLGGDPEPTPAEDKTTQVTYERGKAKQQRPEECVNDSGLRFSDMRRSRSSICTPSELTGLDADQYKVIGTKTNFRLAQRPASYGVLQYDQPIIKHKAAELPHPSPVPANVLDRSLADVTLLVGLLVNKFQILSAPVSSAVQRRLISDGDAAYARYAEQNTGVIHAQCWVHSRRQLSRGPGAPNCG